MGAFIAWIFFSILVGSMGSGRKIGFAGAFFLSLLLSPLIGVIFTALSKSNADAQREAQMLALQQQQAAALANMQQKPAPPQELNLPQDFNARAARLKDLRDRGMITQEEFMDQLGRL
jgi:cbb3-type cytochrome oxidase subunit 3